MRNYRIFVAMAVMAVVLCSCRGKKEALAVLSEEEFFTSGLAEISGRLVNDDRFGNERMNRLAGAIFFYKDDIVTGESHFRSFDADFGDKSFHDWIRIPSPRIVMTRGNHVVAPDIYLEGGKKLTMELDIKTGDCVFSGELGPVNRELNEAPKMTALDEINARIESDSTFTAAEAYALYEAADSIWRKELNAYLGSGKISEVGKRILGNAPVFQKAYWLMQNEAFLQPQSAADYAPLREALLVDDSYLMSQRWPGGLVKNLAMSDLLKRLGKEMHAEKTSDYTTAVMRYMERFDELGRFLGVEGMPMLAQLAVARTLCTGGLLSRASGVEEALAIVDTVVNSYMPAAFVRNGVEGYAKRIFKNGRYEVRDTPEGKMLKKILAPYAGKHVIMDFWTNTCPPCIREMRDTREVREKYRGNPDWVMLFVTGEDVTPKEKYDEVVKKYLQGDETLLLDRDTYRRLTAMFDVGGVPHKVLFDRDGAVLDENYRIGETSLTTDSRLR